MHKRAVYALGGNALISDREHQSVQDQYEAAGRAAVHIADMIEQGWEVVVTHGNGPQIGFILRRSELASGTLHEVPLDVCGADAQGAIGYALQQNLGNVLKKRGVAKTVVTLITQTEVSADDSAFSRPTKTIGTFMIRERAMLHQTRDGWDVVEDAGRGWRRVVASPQPTRIIETDAILALLASGVVTITSGGGGIPVVADEGGALHGVPAVVDKDLVAALLANALNAELLIISTPVERVALNWGRADQEWIDRLTVKEARRLLAEGTHFDLASMGPKVQAAINYLEGGGRRAIITSPECVGRALEGKTGTHFLP